MRLINDIKLDFKDVLFVPKRSTLRSRKEVQIERVHKFKHSGREWSGTSLIVANMDTVGTFEMAKASSPEVLPYVAISSGTSDKDFELIQLIAKAVPAVNFLCLDIANGYSEHFVEYVVKCRKTFPHHTIIAGNDQFLIHFFSYVILYLTKNNENIFPKYMTNQLILSGADIVKVGIGPGSVCTTRKQTGVGYPQLSAIIECAESAHVRCSKVIADGGCKCPGDIAKAFGAGADFVMAGGMFAGHDESGGELVEIDGHFYKMFYGMSSATAMQKHVCFKYVCFIFFQMRIFFSYEILYLTNFSFFFQIFFQNT
eukprot:GSMAST32.ASY1.ANO1.388.1 assembled CDS